MIECPVPDGFDCAYCNPITGECKLADPMNECDDYYVCVGDEEEEV